MMAPAQSDKQYVVVLAVLPDYRARFLDAVRVLVSPEHIEFAAGMKQLIPSVRSADHPGVRRLRNIALFGRRLLWQRGCTRVVKGAATVVVDLNPRSLSAWVILIRGRMRRERVLVWGHLLPRAGATAPTAPVRRLMRNLASGVICYTWTDGERLREEARERESSQGVWVAANALYSKSEMRVAGPDVPEDVRRDIIYVGRFVPEKKVELAVAGFAKALLARAIPRGARLILVGDGDSRETIRETAASLGVVSSVEFVGWENDWTALERYYARALCSVSPGYVGLGLTQSLGFGVPMIVADNEPHAPEVELLTERTGLWFGADDADDLARAFANIYMHRQVWHDRRSEICNYVRARYSTEAMAEGFVNALRGIRK